MQLHPHRKQKLEIKEPARSKAVLEVSLRPRSLGTFFAVLRIPGSLRAVYAFVEYLLRYKHTHVRVVTGF